MREGHKRGRRNGLGLGDEAPFCDLIPLFDSREGGGGSRACSAPSSSSSSTTTIPTYHLPPSICVHVYEYDFQIIRFFNVATLTAD